MTKKVYLHVDKDGLTGGLQVSIGDDDGGYRLYGPKYCGQSKSLVKIAITRTQAQEIRGYLDQAHPQGAS